MSQKNNKKFILDYNTSKKFDKIQEDINKFLWLDMNSTCVEAYRDATKKLNEVAFKLAQEHHMSIWDVCLKFFPQMDVKNSFNEETQRCTTEILINLVPIEYDFKKDEEYWKAKYYKLKEEMQELISRSEELLLD